MSNRNPLIQVALIAGLVLLGLLSGRAVGTAQTDELLLPVGVIILLITLVNPFASLVIYTLGFMRVGSYQEIGTIQIATAAYTTLLFLTGFARFLWRAPWDRAVVRTVTLMFALMGYLAISIVIARTNGIGFGDWGRGAFPLIMLCLAAVFATTVQTRRQWNVTAGVFIFIILNLGASGASALGARVGAALGVPDLVNWGSTIIPASLISVGVAMMVEKRQFLWGYAAMVLIGLIAAVLTPTRTVWISAGLTVTILAGATMFRRRSPGIALAVVAFTVLIAGTTLLMWRYSGESSWGEQTARFETLQRTEEDPSIQIRREQINEALRVFAASPLIGAGLGYKYQYRITFTTKYEDPNDFNHSDVANALAKTGLLGTGLIYGLLITAVLAAVRLQKVGPTPEDRAMGIAAEATLIVAMVIGNSTPMLQEKGSAFILALLIGLLLTRLNLIAAEEAERSSSEDAEGTGWESLAPGAREAPAGEC